MKKPCLPLALLAALFFVKKEGAAQCGCPVCPAYIHDQKEFNYPITIEGAASDDLAAPGQGVCEVNLTLIHTWIGDARLELRSPAGDVVRFFGHATESGYTDNTVWAVKFLPCAEPVSPDAGFDSTFTSAQYWGENKTWTGSYHPQEGCLEDFDEGPINGTWTLTVADDYDNDVGWVTEFSIVFCDTTGISCHGCTDLPATAFVATNDGFDVHFENATTGALAYTWDFGDGTQSENYDEVSPDHNFPDIGQYLVGLTGYNECGYVNHLQWVTVAGAVPVPFFGLNVSSGCEPLGVHFSDSTLNNPLSWFWQMPGASPDTSHLRNPTVTYEKPGLYPVTLTATNQVSSNSLTINDLVEVLTIPVAGFSTNQNQLAVDFLNESTGAAAHEWDFGDGSTSSEESPMHTFPAVGSYFVGLVSKNDCGDDFFGKTITLETVAAGENGRPATGFLATPNPATEGFRLTGLSIEKEKVQARLFNPMGQLVDSQWVAPSGGALDHWFSTERLSAGVYFLEVGTASAGERLPVVILKN